MNCTDPVPSACIAICLPRPDASSLLSEVDANAADLQRDERPAPQSSLRRERLPVVDLAVRQETRRAFDQHVSVALLELMCPREAWLSDGELQSSRLPQRWIRGRRCVSLSSDRRNSSNPSFPN